jgi:hypothetical protein
MAIEILIYFLFLEFWPGVCSGTLSEPNSDGNRLPGNGRDLAFSGNKSQEWT